MSARICWGETVTVVETEEKTSMEAIKSLYDFITDNFPPAVLVSDINMSSYLDDGYHVVATAYISQ